MTELGAYTDPKPDTKVGRLRTELFNLLDEHRRDGMLPTSARFLFYELVQRRVISKQKTGARRADQDMSDALTDLRERGHIPWHWIVDETRSLDSFVGSRSISDWCLGVLDQARIDPWKGDAPLVITESRSLAGVLREMCRDYAVRITATNGQCGGFLRTDVAPIRRGGSPTAQWGRAVKAPRGKAVLHATRTRPFITLDKSPERHRVTIGFPRMSLRREPQNGSGPAPLFGLPSRLVLLQPHLSPSFPGPRRAYSTI